MKSAHQKTLVAIFQQPVPKNLAWRKIEALFVALAADVSEGRGSRVAIVLNGQRGDFHRPHPKKKLNLIKSETLADCWSRQELHHETDDV